MQNRVLTSGLLTLALGLSGCSETRSGEDGGDGGPGLGDDGGGGQTSEDTGSADPGADDERLDLGVEPDSGDGVDDDDECAAVVEDADVEKQPADIVFIVDNSGSMVFEAGFVQDNLNAFSQQIVSSGIDVHVALLSSYPGQGAGMCIAPPLGSGMCPDDDSNPPGFVHVDQEIGSNDALEQLIARHADWQPVRRENASLHLVVVSDDNSTMDAATFDSMFKGLDPSYEDYIFHGIVAETEPVGSLECLPVAAQKGKVYIELIESTGGVLGNLCTQDFQPVFDELSTEVISGSTLSCEWAIPDPPEDMEFDKDKVNVQFDDGNGNTIEIGRVEDPSECDSVMDGWHYDDPQDPTQIIVCPQTCERIQGFVAGSIEILFGCASRPAQ